MTFSEIYNKYEETKPIIEEVSQDIDNEPEIVQDNNVTTSEVSDMEVVKLYPLFGLDGGIVTEKERDMLRVIADYLQPYNDNLAAGLTKLESNIGKAPLDVKRLQHVYNSIKFKNYSEGIYGTQNSDSAQRQDTIGNPRENANRAITISIETE